MSRTFAHRPTDEPTTPRTVRRTTRRHGTRSAALAAALAEYEAGRTVADDSLTAHVLGV